MIPCASSDALRVLARLHACVRRVLTVLGAQDTQAALEAAGVAHISCNPVTANNAARALLGVAQAERMALSRDQAQRLAEAASGDLRSALEMLPLLAVGQAPTQAAPKTQKVTFPAWKCCSSRPWVRTPHRALER